VLKDVLDAMGPWAIVPAVLFVLGGYAISMLTGLHRTRSQQRIEFLGLWRGAGQMDDMALEVAVRHLCGTYLPASVIRRICSTDHCADGIFQVAQIWPLLQYEKASGNVSWKKPKHNTEGALTAGERWYSGGYFALAISAMGFLFVAVEAGPKSLWSWLCGLNAMLFVVLAFSCLAKSETFALAKRTGLQWIEKLRTPFPESLKSDGSDRPAVVPQ
jgi:hypothetical protein